MNFRILERFRDTLLPKLISGELRVESLKGEGYQSHRLTAMMAGMVCGLKMYLRMVGLTA
jgi:hypothetical protein